MYKLPRDLGISGVKLGVCVDADNIIGPDLFTTAKVTSRKNEKIYLYSEWEQVSKSRISYWRGYVGTLHQSQPGDCMKIKGGGRGGTHPCGLLNLRIH